MGISAVANNRQIKVGSSTFVGKISETDTGGKPLANRTTVHVSSNENYKGCYVFQNEYRNGVTKIFETLVATGKQVVILSGDNDGERSRLERLLPNDTKLLFNQKPEDKLEFIKRLRQEGKTVMMVGDGLNDAGALKQSDVGLVISENINVFSPACDGILDASRFGDLIRFLELSRKSVRTIQWAFVLSLLYNLIGLSFAVTGHLKPVVAAILMPLSSISIVVFTTLAVQWVSNRERTIPNKQR